MVEHATGRGHHRAPGGDLHPAADRCGACHAGHSIARTCATRHRPEWRGPRRHLCCACPGSTPGTGRAGQPLALRDVSLERSHPARLGIIGESGSGKDHARPCHRRADAAPLRRGQASRGQRLGTSVGTRSREQLPRDPVRVPDGGLWRSTRDTGSRRILGRPLSFYFGLSGAEAQRRVLSCSPWSSCLRSMRRGIRGSSPAAAPASQPRPRAGGGAEADRLRRDHVRPGYGGSAGDSRSVA